MNDIEKIGINLKIVLVSVLTIVLGVKAINASKRIDALEQRLDEISKTVDANKRAEFKISIPELMAVVNREQAREKQMALWAKGGR